MGYMQKKRWLTVRTRFDDTVKKMSASDANNEINNYITHVSLVRIPFRSNLFLTFITWIVLQGLRQNLEQPHARQHVRLPCRTVCYMEAVADH
jgi:hypothetical protein